MAFILLEYYRFFTVSRNAANCVVKHGLLAPNRLSFTMQKVTFCKHGETAWFSVPLFTFLMNLL